MIFNCAFAIRMNFILPLIRTEGLSPRMRQSSDFRISSAFNISMNLEHNIAMRLVAFSPLIKATVAKRLDNRANENGKCAGALTWKYPGHQKKFYLRTNG
jgi:hypothetical protein